MTPYARKALDMLGVTNAGLIDLYLPGLHGSESVGRSIEDAIKPMQDHLKKYGGEEGARKHAVTLGAIPD